MFHSHPLRLLSICCLLIFLASCGGGNSGTGVYSTGLDGTRRIQTVTESEYEQICRRFQESATNYFEDNKVGFCTFGGLFAASLNFGGEEENKSPIDICEDVLVDCLNSPLEQSDDETPTDECFVGPEGIPGCEASIAELETCLSDTINSFGGALNTLSCESASTAQSLEDALAPAIEALSAVTPSAACQSLAAQCPELLVTEPPRE